MARSIQDLEHEARAQLETGMRAIVIEKLEAEVVEADKTLSEAQAHLTVAESDLVQAKEQLHAYNPPVVEGDQAQG